MNGPIKAAFTMVTPDLQQGGSITPTPDDGGISALSIFYSLQF